MGLQFTVCTWLTSNCRTRKHMFIPHKALSVFYRNASLSAERWSVSFLHMMQLRLTDSPAGKSRLIMTRKKVFVLTLPATFKTDAPTKHGNSVYPDHCKTTYSDFKRKVQKEILGKSTFSFSKVVGPSSSW